MYIRKFLHLFISPSVNLNFTIKLHLLAVGKLFFMIMTQEDFCVASSNVSWTFQFVFAIFHDEVSIKKGVFIISSIFIQFLLCSVVLKRERSTTSQYSTFKEMKWKKKIVESFGIFLKVTWSKSSGVLFGLFLCLCEWCFPLL